MTDVWLVLRTNRNRKGDLPTKLVGVYATFELADKEREAIMHEVRRWDYPSAVTIEQTPVIGASEQPAVEKER